MSRPPNPTHRILFFDDNVRDIGGHYLELASLLADGARDLGYEPELVAHESLAGRIEQASRDTRIKNLPIDPRFRVRRMENWSLGVDGSSSVQRDTTGAPVTRSRVRRLREALREIACRPSRRPRTMLRQWSAVFEQSVRRFDPQPGDRIVINTGGDFQLLALADAIGNLNTAPRIGPMSIHVLFHFAVFDSHLTDRARAFGRQVNAALEQMNAHEIRLHATTEALTEQLWAVGIDATAVPYPTRTTDRSSRRIDATSKTKILLAGMPRAEKGRDQIRQLLEAIEHSHLRSNRFSWSMQLPPKRWQRYIPSSMHRFCNQASTQPESAELQIMRGNLTGEAYHRWLDTAGIGLFLYDPDRYVARCSGVLLEMMVRGVPVIVPNHCWLADQVRAVDEAFPIGWIYDAVCDIPGILDEAYTTLSQVATNCRRHAPRIAAHHSGKNTLLEMGVWDARLADQRSAAMRRAS